MAERLGTDHHEIEFRPEKMVEDIPRMVRHLDEPFTSGPIYLNYLVASLASTQVKTVMGGEGADELLGGYEWMRLDWPYLLRPFVPHWFTEMLIPKIKSQRWRRALRIVGARTAVESDPEWRRSFCADEKRLLLKPEYRAGAPDIGPLVLARDIQETCGDSLQRRLAHDVTARLGEGLLFAEDKTTMAHSLELRLPFLDRSVIDLVLRLPSRLKVRKGREKIVLSHLARHHLPARIAQRRKKGLGFPEGTWRSGPVGEYGRQILMDSKNGPFDRRALERWMRERPRAGRIAGLIMLQAWWNEFVG
jgi:asparagine synthase (glutamine-hydrolysing)